MKFVLQSSFLFFNSSWRKSRPPPFFLWPLELTLRPPHPPVSATTNEALAIVMGCGKGQGCFNASPGETSGGRRCKNNHPLQPLTPGVPPQPPCSHKYLSPPIDHRELQGKKQQQNETEVKIFSRSRQDAAVPWTEGRGSSRSSNSSNPYFTPEASVESAHQRSSLQQPPTQDAFYKPSVAEARMVHVRIARSRKNHGSFTCNSVKNTVKQNYFAHLNSLTNNRCVWKMKIIINQSCGAIQNVFVFNVFKVYMQFVNNNFIFQIESALLFDSWTEQRSSQSSTMIFHGENSTWEKKIAHCIMF